LLDARDTDGLLALFAPGGALVSPGTGGLPLGGAGLKKFFSGLGPVLAQHVVTAGAQSAGVSLAEGFSRPSQSASPRFLIASALLDGAGLITRITMLVSEPLDPDRERALMPGSA
jgi:hypothetical protein